MDDSSASDDVSESYDSEDEEMDESDGQESEGSEHGDQLSELPDSIVLQESQSSEHRDRLSELPDPLILLILSLLPMKDVVRTTLLSKRWKNLWTTVPCLNFECQRYGDEDDLVAFQNFVNRTLIFWKGTKILKFHVGMFFYDEVASDLDLWLRFAIENEVEELHVDLLNDWDVGDGYVDTGYRALQRLYSCSSIRKLSLVGCRLEIRGKVQWEQLKSLTIDGVSLTEHVINQVLSGAPQLEVLVLRFAESYENVNIRSSSLKMLTIETFDADGAEDTVLTIWAPNVETLKILGVIYTKCVLMNVSSLTNVTLRFDYAPKYFRNGRFSGYKLLEDILAQVYHNSHRHRVEKVKLPYWCIDKVLGEMKKKDMLASLSNAKFLKVYAGEVNKIVGLLEIFPKLMTLVIEDRDPSQNDNVNFFEVLCDIREPFVTEFDMGNSLESKTDFPESRLLHLTTVEIAWVGRDHSIFPIVEFLLKYASKLEKLVFRVVGWMSGKSKSKLLAAEKLLRLPRSSPTAEVILC